MNNTDTPVPSDSSELTDVFPVNHPNQWPILKDLWAFFSGNAGNISVLSVNSSGDVLPDLKLTEKVGGKITLCVPTEDDVSFLTNVKMVLKERSKSELIKDNEVLTAISKCWVLANRVTILKGLPFSFNGSAEVTVKSAVDLSGADLSGVKVTVPLVDIFDLTDANYFDIVKVDFPGMERQVLSGIMDAGMRPSLIMVRWSEAPNSTAQARAAAATLQNHGYTLLSVVDDKYLYHYNDKPFYNLADWETPSMKNPMVEMIIGFTKSSVSKRLSALIGL